MRPQTPTPEQILSVIEAEEYQSRLSRQRFRLTEAEQFELVLQHFPGLENSKRATRAVRNAYRQREARSRRREYLEETGRAAQAQKEGLYSRPVIKDETGIPFMYLD